MTVIYSLPHLTATRCVTPLRDGGPPPAVVETEHGDSFVTKFVAAG